MPKFSCPHCGQHIDADDSYAGSEVACPNCQQAMIVPGAPAAPVAAAAPPQYRPPQNRAPRPGYAPPGAYAPPPPRGYPPQYVPPPEKKGWQGPLILGLVASLLMWGSMFAGMFFGMRISLAERNADSATQVAGVGMAFFMSLVTFVSTAGVVLLVALLIGGLLAIFRLSFLRSFLISYAVCMLAALLLTAVSVMATALGSKIIKDHPPAAQTASPRPTTPPDEAPAPERKTAVNPAPSPEADSIPTQTKKAPSQEAIRLSALIVKFANDISTARQNYFNEASGAGLTKVLDADRLAADLDLTDTKKTLATARSSLGRARIRTEELTAAFPSHLAEVHGGPSLESAQTLLVANLPLYKEHWDREAETLDCYEEAANLLHVARAQWVPHDHKFSINSKEVAEKFTAIMKRMSDSRKRQQAMLNQITSDANQSLAQLAQSPK